MAEDGSEDVQEKLPHSRAPDFRVHPVNGALLYPIASPEVERWELSFYADRPNFLEEGIQPHPESSGIGTPDGRIRVQTVREHVTAISGSVEVLRQIRDMIDRNLPERSDAAED